MKRQPNGIYSNKVKNPENADYIYRLWHDCENADYIYRLWHDCDRYKNRDSARVEMRRVGTFLDPLRGDKIKFKCDLCGFTQAIEKSAF